MCEDAKKFGGMKYEHMKQFYDSNGLVVYMKSLLTIHGEQFIEVFGSEKRYKINELTEVV